MKTWLIRHPNLSFERPLTQDELIAQIEAGSVQAHDELCPAGGYWFSLSEVDEVRKHLGDIQLKSMMPEGDESTSSTRPALDAKTLITAPKPAEPPARVAKDAPATRPQPTVTRELTSEPELGVDWVKLVAFIAIFLGILTYLWTQSR